MHTSRIGVRVIPAEDLDGKIKAKGMDFLPAQGMTGLENVYGVRFLRLAA